MKYTLLEMSQSIASALDSDEFNSIFDTVESRQIAETIRTAYFDIVSRADLPEHLDLFELTASGDITKPTLMTLPSGVRHIEWLKYNKIEDGETAPNFREITYCSPYEFINLIHQFSTDEDNVGTFSHTIGSDSVDFFYKNDKHPDYYTLYDDNTLIFDSYQSNIDTTLQKTKTLGYGQKTPTFTMLDAFTPDLDERQFALLLNEAKVLAFAELKQSPHPVSQMNARKQWINMKKTRSTVPSNFFDQLPNYGRK